MRKTLAIVAVLAVTPALAWQGKLATPWTMQQNINYILTGDEYSQDIYIKDIENCIVENSHTSPPTTIYFNNINPKSFRYDMNGTAQTKFGKPVATVSFSGPRAVIPGKTSATLGMLNRPTLDYPWQAISELYKNWCKAAD